MQSFSIPVSTNFLKQTQRVNDLINAVLEALPAISDTTAKNNLLLHVNTFNFESTTTSLNLVDVMLKAESHGIKLDTDQAIGLIEAASNDINNNYAHQAIEYQLDLLAGTEISKEKSPIKIRAGRLHELPEIDELSYTDFDSWVQIDSNGKATQELANWDDEDSNKICFDLIKTYSELLKEPLTFLVDGIQFGLYKTQSEFFKTILDLFTEKGYFVYWSETRFAIYDSVAINASYSIFKLIEMLE